MRRKVKGPGPKFRSMNWFDQLFWQRCKHCGDEFKREPGWKAGPYMHEDGSYFHEYVCGQCVECTGLPI